MIVLGLNHRLNIHSSRKHTDEAKTVVMARHVKIIMGFRVTRKLVSSLYAAHILWLICTGKTKPFVSFHVSATIVIVCISFMHVPTVSIYHIQLHLSDSGLQTWLSRKEYV